MANGQTREKVDAGAIVVIHPRCLTAIVIEDVAVDESGEIVVDGLCYACQRYVHLQISTPLFRVMSRAETMTATIERVEGRASRAAKALGISRATLWKRCRQYHISMTEIRKKAKAQKSAT